VFADFFGSDDWNVHVTARERFMAAHPETIAEEATYFDRPEGALPEAVGAALDGIRERMGLDFFGIDFAVLEDGRVLFTPFVAVGEQVEVEIVAAKKSFAQGRLVSIREASPERIEPRCPYFGNCGRCRYQPLPYATQLPVKEKPLGATLRRICQAELGEVRGRRFSSLMWWTRPSG